MNCDDMLDTLRYTLMFRKKLPWYKRFWKWICRLINFNWRKVTRNMELLKVALLFTGLAIGAILFIAGVMLALSAPVLAIIYVVKELFF